MNQFQCPYANHYERKIITICLDKDCKQKRLCCFQCVNQFHNTHCDKLIDVKQFNHFIQQQSKMKVQAKYEYENWQFYLNRFFLLQQRYQNQDIAGQQWTEYYIADIIKFAEANKGQINLKKQDGTQIPHLLKEQSNEKLIQDKMSSQYYLEQILNSSNIQNPLKQFPENLLDLIHSQPSFQLTKQVERFKRISIEIYNIQMRINLTIDDQATLIQEKKIKAPQKEQFLFIQSQNSILIKKLEDYLTQLTYCQKKLEEQNEKIQSQKNILQQQQETIKQCKLIIETLRKEKQRVIIQLLNCKKMEQKVNDELETIQLLKIKINEQTMNKKDFLEVIEQLKDKLQTLSNQQILMLAEMQDNNTYIKYQEKYLISSIQISMIEQNKIQQLRFNDKPFELVMHKKNVCQALTSEDGSIIVSGSLDKTIKVWDTQRKQQIKTIQLKLEVYQIALSPNNQYLAFSDSDKNIKLYDLKQNKYLGVVKKNTNTIKSLIFSQDNKYLISGGKNNQLTIWGMILQKEVNFFKTNSSITMIVISPDNRLISFICVDQGQINIWDFQTKTKLIEENNAHEFGSGLCSSTDSSLFISSGSEGLIKLWKLEEFPNQKWLLTFIQQIKVASTINFVYQKRRILRKYFPKEKYYYSSLIDRVILTQDEQFIISICNQEGKIMIHEKESGKWVEDLNSRAEYDYTGSISISNDMNTLVSTNGANQIYVWKIE